MIRTWGRRKGQGVNTCAQVRSLGSHVGGGLLGHLRRDASRQQITRICSFFPMEICTYSFNLNHFPPDSHYQKPPYLTCSPKSPYAPSVQSISFPFLSLLTLYHHIPFLKHPCLLLISKVLTKSSLSAFLLSPHFQQANSKEPPTHATVHRIQSHCRHSPVSTHSTLEASLFLLS